MTFVLCLNIDMALTKKLKIQFQMQQFNQLKHNEVTSCTIHAHMHEVEYKSFTSACICQVLYIFMNYYQQKRIKTNQIRKCIRQPSGITNGNNTTFTLQKWAKLCWTEPCWPCCTNYAGLVWPSSLQLSFMTVYTVKQTGLTHAGPQNVSV